MQSFKFIFLSFIYLSSNIVFAQDKTVKAYLNEKQFFTPEQGNYFEIQLNFVGYSLNYIEEENKTIAKVEVTHVFSQADSIVAFDKYVLDSPEVIDSLVEDFHDIQRFALEPGNYKYELEIKDINSKKDAISIEKDILINDFKDEVGVSAITNAESIKATNPTAPSIFSKIGYDVVPMASNYYPTELEWLPYYAEVYNTDSAYEDSVYVVEQKITGKDNGYDLEKYSRYYRYDSSPLQPIAKVIDISMLPTGAYNLELNVLNREKEVITSQTFRFDRNNTDEVNELAYDNITLDPAFEESIPMDSTGYYVASLIPISRSAEVKNIIRILKEKDNEKNKKYIQAFWKASSPKSPYEGWRKYKTQVQEVQRLYATNYQAGFETDRGRVFLQYGQPNQITERPSSPSEYPYEIWQFDKIGRFSNKRFVFYNPSNLNKDYRLLHSDMVGEIQNFRWKYALNKRNTPDENLDDPNGSGNNHFGGNSSLYYNSY
ncbi:MAG: GWxTD domain-containing protein [Brumimicrobium sp.]